MDKIRTGSFISQKRKEINMTQEQLAEKLGISNKTISKWECGKCMPDYSIVQPLCQQLGITIAELMDGNMNDRNNICSVDDRQMTDMLKRIQVLEKQKQSMLGIMLIIIGISMFALSQLLGGSGFRDFISGVLLGASIAETLVGVYLFARTMGTGNS
ncbi:helix-turn-helix transcriptional regulator [Diplocloster hominis]|uniref:helix-turn-helix domain-containing protein n=1 Tax=Diplocloster hominis TaxID=3079010 RepID=UPI0031BB437B